VEAESTTALASTHREVEDFAWRIALLEGELAEVCQAREVTEENSWGLFDAAADAERWREEFERECWERVEELTLMQTRGSELCLAIVGRLRVRSFLSEEMHIAALLHTGMAEQLAMLQAAVSSAAEFMLRHSPFETFWVEVVDEMFAEF
jgi:hypothetical protein